MTFPQRGFVLLALPKTASTTLEQTLAPYASLVVSSPPGRKHLPARAFEREMVPQLERQGFPRGSYELVTMFREPIAWLESWWRYRARESARPGRSTAGISFEDYAARYARGDRSASAPRGRPARFIRAGSVVAVDRIFALDRPEVWSSWFAERLGRELVFEHRNASATGIKGELSDRTRAALMDYLAPEYDVWRRLSETGQWAGARGTRLAQ